METPPKKTKPARKRSLGHAERIQALSDKEITTKLARTVVDLAEADVQFRGRKLKTGPLVNAIVLDFMRKPLKTQIQIAEATLPELDKLLAEDPTPKAKKPKD